MIETVRRNGFTHEYVFVERLVRAVIESAVGRITGSVTAPGEQRTTMGEIVRTEDVLGGDPRIEGH